jgi:hypothetical protein
MLLHSCRSRRRQRPYLCRRCYVSCTRCQWLPSINAWSVVSVFVIIYLRGLLDGPSEVLCYAADGALGRIAVGDAVEGALDGAAVGSAVKRLVEECAGFTFWSIDPFNGDAVSDAVKGTPIGAPMGDAVDETTHGQYGYH